MIIGRVNAQGEAIIRVQIRGPGVPGQEFDAVLDTGFNHELTLPSELIRTLVLEYAAPGQAMLAGEVRLPVDCYRARIIWENVEREVVVLEIEGVPLIGMALLAERRVTINVTPGGLVQIEPLPM